MPAKPKTTEATPEPTLDTSYVPELDDLPDDDEPIQAAKKPVETPVKDSTPAATDGPASKHAHSPRLVNMAVSLGIPQSKIDAWDSERLEETVELLTLQAVAASREANRSEILARTAPKPAEAPAPPPEEEIDLGFDTTGWDEATVAALKAFAKKQREPYKALEAEVKVLREREHGRMATTVFEAIEDGFAALPDGYANAIGKGEFVDVDEDAQAVRKNIVNRASADYAAAHGGRPLENATARQIKAAIEAAAIKLYGKFVAAKPSPAPAAAVEDDDDEAEELVESYPVQNKPTRPAPQQDPKTGRIVSPTAGIPKSSIDEQVERFKRGKVAVPTNRISPAEGRPGRAKAEATAAAYLASMNGSPDDGE